MNAEHEFLKEQAQLILEHLDAETEPDMQFIAVHAEALMQHAWAAIEAAEA